MKQIVLVIFLSFLITFGMSAASADLVDFAMDVTDNVIDAIEFGGRPAMNRIQEHMLSLNVDSMSLEQRREIYESYRVSSGFAILRNVFIGFGNGSKRQGDSWGTLIGSIGDGLGIGLLTASATCFLIDLMTFQTIGAATGSQEVGSLSDSPLMGATKALAISGAIVIGVNRLIGIIPPLVYSARYNSKLRDGLGLDKDLNLVAGPVVDPITGDSGIMMMASVSF